MMVPMGIKMLSMGEFNPLFVCIRENLGANVIFLILNCGDSSMIESDSPVLFFRLR